MRDVREYNSSRRGIKVKKRNKISVLLKFNVRDTVSISCYQNNFSSNEQLKCNLYVCYNYMFLTGAVCTNIYVHLCVSTDLS